MNVDYPTIDEPATAEYVLAVLQDEHRQQCEYDSVADPGISLSFDSTVAEWRAACDLVGWRELGPALNSELETCLTAAQWKSVLEPAGEKRLKGVCELIAQQARQPRIRPACLLGTSCRSAGAFLTVRSMLQQAGVDVSEISPSSSLQEYTRRHSRLFLGRISRLAPGALPPVRFETPAYNAATGGVIAGLMCLSIGALGGLHGLTILGVMVYGSAHLFVHAAAKCIPPASVEFGDLRTFRDLAILMSEGSPLAGNAAENAIGGG